MVKCQKLCLSQAKLSDRHQAYNKIKKNRKQPIRVECSELSHVVIEFPGFLNGIMVIEIIIKKNELEKQKPLQI
uniref:Uncharacterized protein n=1 Tax=Rhizophora mucronata TaxID=61149 RepID=A0A2P2NYK1_RHIMU